jgi:hypothetical protein
VYAAWCTAVLIFFLGAGRGVLVACARIFMFACWLVQRASSSFVQQRVQGGCLRMLLAGWPVTELIQS